MKAIVVGAGLAGLTAAMELKKASWDVQVLDERDYPGGRVATVEKQGYRFDVGAVGAGTVYTDLMQLVEELGLQPLIKYSSTVTSTYRDGIVHEIDSARPITGLLTRLFSWRSKFAMIRLAMDIRKVKDDIDIRDVAAASELDDESAYDYANRRLTQELADYFVTPMIRTLNLSRANRVSRLELLNALTGLFDTTFLTLDGGLAAMPRAIAERLDVRLNTAVSEVVKHEDGVEVHCRRLGGDTETLTADACIIATPLPCALQIYPGAREELAPLSDHLSYSRSLVVTLGYNKPTTTEAMMVMLPVQESEEYALLFLEHNKGPDRAPPGKSIVTVFFDATTLDTSLAKTDEQLLADTSAFVEKVLPELSGALEMTHITRWGSEGLTLPAVGSFKLMQAVNAKLDAASRVQYAGDYFSTAGQNSAIVYGKRAAGNLIAELGG